MGFFIKFIVPLIMLLFLIASYLLMDRTHLFIMGLGNMAIMFVVGRVYQLERR